jgi:hypothetical protein
VPAIAKIQYNKIVSVFWQITAYYEKEDRDEDNKGKA